MVDFVNFHVLKNFFQTIVFIKRRIWT